MSISPPITRAPAAVILFVAIALVQTLSATAAAVAIRSPSVFLAIDMPATSSRSIISSGATAVAPIPRVSYVHKRGESQKKKDIRINKRRAEALGESACEESVEIQMMSDFVAEIESNNVAPPPAKKKQRLAKNKTPLVQFKLDVEPAGGEEYSKKEVCEILSKYKPRSGTRAAAMKAIIEHNAKYVEGCSKPTINRLMIAYGEKKFDRLTTAWSGKGRPAVLSDKDINGIVESIKGKAGEAFSSKDIEGMMNRKITEHLDQNGIHLLDCQRSERLKKKRENAKHQAKIDANLVAVKRLVGMLKADDAEDKFAFLSDSDESALEHSTLEHFFNLRAQEL
ncbi:hypothetical protein THAOC_18391, partial [Thalassiosira oceanica]